MTDPPPDDLAWALQLLSAHPAFHGLALFLGASVGSFLNVVVARWPQGRSVVTPGSMCPHCGHHLRWFELIPVVSFIALGARCAACKKPISWRYPAVEGVMAVAYWGSFAHYGLTVDLLFWAGVWPLLLTIVLLDLDHFWIPFACSVPLLVLGLLGAGRPSGPGWLFAALGVLPAGVLWSVGVLYAALRGREGLGFGDVMLLAGLGTIFGPVQAMWLLLLAAVQGTLVAIPVQWRLMARAGEPVESIEPVGAVEPAGPHEPVDPNDEPWVPPPGAIPFGPLLVLAAVELVLFPDLPDQLFAWWLNLLR